MSKSKNVKKTILSIVKLVVLMIAATVIPMFGSIGIYTIFQKVYMMSNSSVTKDQLNVTIAENPLFLLLLPIAYILFTVILFAFAKKFDKRSMLKIIFKDSFSVNVKKLFLGVGIAIVTMCAFLAFGSLTGILQYQKELSLQNINSRLIYSVICGLVFSILTAFYEESFFRAYALSELSFLGRKLAVIISALIFMISELSSGSSIMDLLGLFFAGLVFASIYIYTSSLFVSVGLHGIINVVLLNIVKLPSFDSGIPTLFTFSANENIHMFGISIGTGSSVCMAFVNVVSFIIIVAYYKLRRSNKTAKIEKSA